MSREATGASTSCKRWMAPWRKRMVPSFWARRRAGQQVGRRNLAERVHVKAGPRHDNELHRIEQAPELSPVGKVEKSVGADQEKQPIVLAQLSPHRPHGVNGVARRPVHRGRLDGGGDKARLARRRQLPPSHSAGHNPSGGRVFCGADCPVGMKRTRSRRKRRCAACAAARCPAWMGSNVPPKIAMFMRIEESGHRAIEQSVHRRSNHRVIGNDILESKPDSWISYCQITQCPIIR